MQFECIVSSVACFAGRHRIIHNRHFEHLDDHFQSYANQLWRFRPIQIRPVDFHQCNIQGKELWTTLRWKSSRVAPACPKTALERRKETTTATLTSTHYFGVENSTKESICVSHTSVSFAVVLHFPKHFHRQYICICESHVCFGLPTCWLAVCATSLTKLVFYFNAFRFHDEDDKSTSSATQCYGWTRGMYVFFLRQASYKPILACCTGRTG